MMQYQVFIQNPTDHLFTASVVGLPEVRSNGTTEEEAIASLKGLLMAQFQSGKFVTIDLEVPTEGGIHQADPWLSNMGLFQDDPTFDDFLVEVETYRSEVDATEVGP